MVGTGASHYSCAREVPGCVTFPVRAATDAPARVQRHTFAADLDPPPSPSPPSPQMSSPETGIELFVPGRVCLFGEHSDWAGSFTRFNSEISPGLTIICGTNQGIFARVRRHPSHLIITATRNNGEKVGPFEVEMNKTALLKVAAEGGFWSYACGVAYKIMTDYRVSGLVIDNYKTDIPIRKGLSSSAAFCVLTARAFNRVYDIKVRRPHSTHAPGLVEQPLLPPTLLWFHATTAYSTTAYYAASPR